MFAMDTVIFIFLENADVEICKNALQLSGLRGCKKQAMAQFLFFEFTPLYGHYRTCLTDKDKKEGESVL